MNLPRAPDLDTIEESELEKEICKLSQERQGKLCQCLNLNFFFNAVWFGDIP